MRKLKIVKHPNPILNKKCKLIKEITPCRQDKIRQMFKLMYEADGIGLAAPQVGWDARIFVMNVDLNRNQHSEMVFINPLIKEESGGIIEFEEGCLSFPGITGAVDRYRKVIIQAQDINGDYFTFLDDSLAARCALHEHDHIDGLTIYDRAKKLYKGKDPL